MKDCWSVLGIAPGASSVDIKKAYRKLALQYHPDRKGGNSAKFRQVQQAYEAALKSKGVPRGNTQKKTPPRDNEKPDVYVTIYVFDFGHEDEIIVFKHSYSKWTYRDTIFRQKGRLTGEGKGRYGHSIKAKFIPCVIQKPYFIIKGENVTNTIGLNIEFDYYTYRFGGTADLLPMQSTHIFGTYVIGDNVWSQIIIPRRKKEHVLKIDVLSQKNHISSNIYEIKIFLKLKEGTWFSRLKELLKGILGNEPYIAPVNND